MPLKSRVSFDKRLGARLRDARLEAGWTLSIMGKKLGVKYNTVHKTESGLIKITAERVTRAARALDKPVAYFLDGLL